MPSRRAVLAAGGLALSAGLAGCNASPPPPEPGFGTPTDAWPTAGYDPGGTGNAPAGPTDATVVWTTGRAAAGDLYGRLSTPVVGDGRVYVAGLASEFFREEEDRSVLAALEAGTGERAWTAAFDAGLSGGPALLGDGVVVGGRDGTLHALDQAGQRRWTAALGRRVGTPTTYGGRLYAADGTGRLSAVSAAGERLWTADRPGPLETLLGPDDPVGTAAPVADEAGVYAAFAPFDRRRTGTVLVAYDHDGGRRWRTVLDNEYSRSVGGLAVAGGTVYATGGGTVHAVGGASGERRWRFVTGFDSAGPPSTDGERVYVAAKNLYALDPGDGTERWRLVNEPRPLGPETAATGQLPYLARPAVAGGQVYLRRGAVSAADGSRRWGGDALGWLAEGDQYTRPFGTRPMATPAVTGDALYLTHAERGVQKLA